MCVHYSAMCESGEMRRSSALGPSGLVRSTLSPALTHTDGNGLSWKDAQFHSIPCELRTVRGLDKRPDTEPYPCLG